MNRRELEHDRAVAEIHQSYKREIALVPRGELARARRGRGGR